MKHKLIILAMMAMAASANAQVVINEVMQSNIDCIVDDLNQFPDSWVELYNSGTTAVNLGEYSVNDAEDASTAWQLPSETLAAGAYKLVYCDKEATGWHTPFRLDSGKGCTFYLFKSGTVVDQLPEGMKKQPAPNVAYGRKTDGASSWGYQLTPSPAAANTGETCDNKKILGDPVFSLKGHVRRNDQNLNVELSLPEDAPEGTVIRYTLDGSEPTAASNAYTSPIIISGSKCLRAKLFCDGYLSPRAATQSYISVDREITMPVISITTDRKYLYDNKFGILVDGSYNRDKKNYEYDWRRPMNFEIWDGDLNEACINQLGEARVTGGATRSMALKSMGIYANKRFGEKRFSHEFFPTQRPGLTEYKSLMLRNAGNDFDGLYMRDAIIQTHMAQYVDIDHQAYQPSIVFINGTYMGMLNIRERSNEDNIYTNYNGLEDIDMVENLWELKEGDINHWYAFQNYYNEHGHTYAEYDEVMDVLEYMNVMILNLYYCNLDFPGNNIVFWKPLADGGRWRVIVKDTDFGLGLYGRDANYKVFEWLYNPNYDSSNSWANQYEHTRLFRRLMEDADFNREFIDRFAIYMGDFMNYNRTWETWQPMYQYIKDEYPVHRALFNPWWPNYDEELNSAKQWLKSRTNNMYNQLNDYYKVGAPKPLTVKTQCGEGREIASVDFNGVELSRGEFDGKFFVGRAIRLEAEGADGWTVTESTNSGKNVVDVNGAVLEYVIPSNASRVDIVARAGVEGGGDTPDQPGNTEGKIIYDDSKDIDWWGEAILFGPEYYDDFRAAHSIDVQLELVDKSKEAHFKFQTLHNDWHQTPLPGQANTPGAWTNGEGDIHVIMTQDGSINIPLTDEDHDLIVPTDIQNIMLVGDNTRIRRVTLNLPAAITDVTVDEVDTPAYNLLGVPVDKNYRGFVIKNGRKMVQK